MIDGPTRRLRQPPLALTVPLARFTPRVSGKGAGGKSRFNGFPNQVKAAEAAPNALRLPTPG